MTKDERLDKLQKAGEQYIQEEKDKLEKEYDFLSDIIKNTDHGNLQDGNSNKASELVVNSIRDFLSGS